VNEGHTRRCGGWFTAAAEIAGGSLGRGFAGRTGMHIQKRAPWLLFLAAFAALAFSALSAFAAGGTDKLFIIQRSKNANEIHYDAHVTKDGALDPNNPVEGYWLNKAEDGSRSGITFLQRVAYGYDVEPSGNGTYALKLKAFGERPMWIVKARGHWRVQTTIAGKPAFMYRLYVATDESGIMPKVLYVDVYGEDMATGAAIQERVRK
jgi:hypothetical protein